MARTHRSHGATSEDPRIYQALLTWHCNECQIQHNLLLSSDDHNVTDAAFEGFLSSLHAGGISPIGVLHASDRKERDISPRDMIVPVEGAGL